MHAAHWSLVSKWAGKQDLMHVVVFPFLAWHGVQSPGEFVHISFTAYMHFNVSFQIWLMEWNEMECIYCHHTVQVRYNKFTFGDLVTPGPQRLKNTHCIASFPSFTDTDTWAGFMAWCSVITNSPSFCWHSMTVLQYFPFGLLKAHYSACTVYDCCHGDHIPPFFSSMITEVLPPTLNHWSLNIQCIYSVNIKDTCVFIAEYVLNQWNWLVFWQMNSNEEFQNFSYTQIWAGRLGFSKNYDFNQV